MYVCVCKAVTKKSVECAIEDGAATREEVTKACGAGGDCGSCHRYIEKMIERRDGLVAATDLVRERAA
jgi:bacterioferritin-associated ferredoxin